MARISINRYSNIQFKIALMEWSDAVHDLITVSIHTYERAPQVVCDIVHFCKVLADVFQMFSEPGLFRADLRVDPLSRCAALSLPKDSLAILPFYQSQAELEVMDQDQDHGHSRSISLVFLAVID